MRLRSIARLSLGLLVGLPGAVLAADTPSLHAGDIDGARLKPYEHVWRYTVRHKDGSVQLGGLWTDRLDRIERAGRTVLRRVEGMTYVSGRTSVQINIFDPKTLASIASEHHYPEGSWLTRSFDGTTVTQTEGKAPGDAGTVKTFTMPEPVINVEDGMSGTVLAALQLKAGEHVSVPAIGPDGVFEAAPFTVLRAETISAGRLGKVQTHVVDASGTLYWIAARPPYVVKITSGTGDIGIWDEL